MEPSSSTVRMSEATKLEESALAVSLNTPQLEAVTHTSGPMLVLAGAGSGKTRVITYRIAHLLATHGVAPYRIYAVTFTNKAAREMKSRIEQLVGPDLSADLWVGTFHATCARLLRRYHNAVGIQRNFVIYDDSDQRSLMSRVIKNLELDDERFSPKYVLSRLHHHKQQGISIAEMPASTPDDRTLLEAFTEYERMMIAANAVDFDDLIVHTMNLAEDASSPEGRELRKRFQHILVDEFQDVNQAQYRLVRALASGHGYDAKSSHSEDRSEDYSKDCSICVVGDDDQSIYRWRGADVRIIRGFKHDFRGTRVVKLEQNYRSTGNVVRAALAVIEPSEEREPKDLFTTSPPGSHVDIVQATDEKDEAYFVANSISKALSTGAQLRQIAIFYRTHAQSRVLEDALRAARIPYQVVGGTRFFDRKEIKDVLAYLRVLVNPSSDVDLLRIINTPARQIGQATIDVLIQNATTTRRCVHEVLTSDPAAIGLKAGPRKRIEAFAAMMEGLRAQLPSLSPRKIVESVLDVTGYEHSLKMEDTPEADARIENLREFLGSVSEYEQETIGSGQDCSLAGYLERVSLVSDVDQAQDGEIASMMTVHASKGLEFEIVFVVGFEDGLFPYEKASENDADIEEERRLAYVAFTRARSRLLLTYTGARTIFGSLRYNTPSSFLDDIPDNITSHRTTRSRSALFRNTTAAAARIRKRTPGERYVEIDEPRRPDYD